MTNGRAIRGLVVTLVALASFHFGFTRAFGAPARIDDIGISQEEGDRTRLKVMLSRGARFRVGFDRVSKTFTLRFPDMRFPDFLEGIEYTDDLIASVSASRSGDDLLLTLTFHEPNILFTRSGSVTRSELNFDFRQSDHSIKVTGMSKEDFLKALKPEPVMVAAVIPEPPAVETPQPTPTIVAEEEVDDSLVDDTEEEPAAEEVTLTAAEREEQKRAQEALDAKEAEEVAIRLAVVDKSYRELERLSGRKDFIALMKAMRKEKKEGLLKAVELADSFIATYPDSVYFERALYARGNAAFLVAVRDSDYIHKALVAYNDATVRFPDSPLVQQAMMRRARLHQRQEFYLEATSEFGALIKRYPTGKYVVSAMLERAEIYLIQKKFAKAYNELERILLLYPNRREVRDVKFLIAESYYNRGKFELATKIFDESVRLWPTFPKTHPRIYLEIADTRYRIGKWEQAERDWLALLNLFPNSSEGREAALRLGDHYSATNRKEEAATLYENLVRRFPDSNRATLATLRLASLGVEDPELLKQSGVFNYSAFANPYKTFDAIFEKNPLEFGQEALLRKGKALTQQKRYLASINAYKEVLRLYPASRMEDEVFTLVRDNFYKLIDTYHAQRGFFMALLTYYNNFAPFLRTIEDPDILVKLADSYDDQSLHARAIKYYQRSHLYDKEGRLTPYTAYRIAKSTFENGHYQGSADMFRAYLARYPANSYTFGARYFLGQSLLRGGDRALAATEWRMALEKSPTSPLASHTSYLLGQLYKKNGDYSLAIDSFNRAIDTYNAPLTDQETAYIKDSYYQIAETSYMSQNYPAAIIEAARFKTRYPDDGGVNWMNYITSASLSRINKDEKAIEQLKALSQKESGAILAKVASAQLNTMEWKQNNPDLFSN